MLELFRQNFKEEQKSLELLKNNTFYFVEKHEDECLLKKHGIKYVTKLEDCPKEGILVTNGHASTHKKIDLANFDLIFKKLDIYQYKPCYDSVLKYLNMLCSKDYQMVDLALDQIKFINPKYATTVHMFCSLLKFIDTRLLTRLKKSYLSLFIDVKQSMFQSRPSQVSYIIDAFKNNTHHKHTSSCWEKQIVQRIYNTEIVQKTIFKLPDEYRIKFKVEDLDKPSKDWNIK